MVTTVHQTRWHAQHHLWAKELCVAKEGGKDHQIEMIGM